MKINPKVKQLLTSSGIPVADGICYLLGVYHEYTASYIPEAIIAKVNALKIAVPTSTGLKWNMALYEGAETAFEWVKKEYCPLFKEVNPERGGHAADATRRMKKFFAENPSYRKEDVIKATKNYLFETDAFYIRSPHYFIQKGRGAEKTSDLLNWLEMLTDDTHFTEPENTGSATTMQ
jgi:hypothetical protein